MRAIFLFVIHLWLCHQRQIMAWTIAPNRARTTNSGRRIETESRTTTALHAGGFGASSSKSNKDKKKTPAKLKPKSQWDRFLDIKGASRIRVAVKTTSNDDDTDNEWLEVGNIKSVDNAYTAFAVARQRALIAEVGYVLCCDRFLQHMPSVTHTLDLASIQTLNSMPNDCFHFRYLPRIPLHGHTGMNRTRRGRSWTKRFSTMTVPSPTGWKR